RHLDECRVPYARQRRRRAARRARDRPGRGRVAAPLPPPARSTRALAGGAGQARVVLVDLVAGSRDRGARRPVRVRELLALRLVLRTAPRRAGVLAVQPGPPARPRRQRRKPVRPEVPPDAAPPAGPAR